MRSRGTYLVPTLSAVRDLAEPGGEYTDPRLVERGREMLAVLRQTVPAAYERGIPIAAGTDTSYTPASQSTVTGEIRLLAEFGLSNLDALRSATTVGAALLRRQGNWAGSSRDTPPTRSSWAGSARGSGRARRRAARGRGRLDRARGLVDKPLLQPPHGSAATSRPRTPPAR